MNLIYVGLIAIVGAMVSRHNKFIEKARPYRDLIADYSTKHDVSPYVLASLFWQESRFDPGAVGGSGEIGLGQISQIAAVDLGLEHIDLRDNVPLQIESSACFLKKMTDAAGDIYNGLRAYNAGLAGSQVSPTQSSGYALSILGNALVDWVYMKMAHAKA